MVAVVLVYIKTPLVAASGYRINLLEKEEFVKSESETAKF